MALDAVEKSANWAQLVREIQAGDARAAAELYSALAVPLRARLSRGVSPEEIEDRVHEILVIVLQAIRDQELRDPERLVGFIDTITRRRMVAHIRSRIFRRRWLVDGVEMVPSPGESPEETALRQERVERLAKVLRRLRPRDREILERFYFREQNAQQICGEMRLTETQFRLFKSRAIARCFDLARPWPPRTPGARGPG